MIRIKEDIAKIVSDYTGLEGKIISVCKKLNIIRKEQDYYGFLYKEDEDKIIVRVSDLSNELDGKIDYDIPISCLFSDYAVSEYRKEILAMWDKNMKQS